VLIVTPFCRMQAAATPKPAADRQLNFQFYRNPAAILADENQQVWPSMHLAAAPMC
jgi:hypothetical protein